MTKSTKTPKNTFTISINRTLNTATIQWNREIKCIERIIENLSLFNITPTQNIKNQIKTLANKSTKKINIDTISI
jgi:hypothetical protein